VAAANSAMEIWSLAAHSLSSPRSYPRIRRVSLCSPASPCFRDVH
jgi:hypothetical protein